MWLLLGCAPQDVGWSFSHAQLDEAVEGYDTWESAPGWEGLNATCTGAHGRYVALYVDPIAAEEDAGSGGYGVGSTMVLESYQDTLGTWKMTVAMHKVALDSNLPGDWYWGQYDEAGALLQGGDIPACASCHMGGKDYAWHRGRAASDCGGETEEPV